jgi:divalent metal cation (Fe/Co/Zn/Cd) transporter
MSNPTTAGGRRPSPSDLRGGVRVSVASVAWALVASTAAVVVGIVDGRLVLVVFGATGLLDAAGSLTLALHFRHALAHEALSVHRERFALRLVSGGLCAIGIATAVESIRRLIGGEASHDSPIGVAIAAASAVVLTALTIWKRKVARLLDSRALTADGWLSATGALLAVVAVTGTLLAVTPDRAWIDPAAALVVATAAVAVGVAELRREAGAISD